MRNDMFDDPALPAAFDRFAESYNAAYDRPYVLDLVRVSDGMTVLDAACGTGLYAAELADRGARVTGVDLSDAMLARARRRLGRRAALVQASLDVRLPFASAVFDRVVFAGTLHYFRDAEPLLRELRRVVLPDGAVVVSTRHPMTDWLRKGGSYFDVSPEQDAFAVDGGTEWTERFWRQPLSRIVEAAFRAGLLVERLVEPLPGPDLAQRSREHYDFLRQRPTFVVLRLVPRSLLPAP